jgi:hypothetical protein
LDTSKFFVKTLNLITEKIKRERDGEELGNQFLIKSLSQMMSEVDKELKC